MKIHDFIYHYSINLVKHSPFMLDIEKFIIDTNFINLEIDQRLRHLAIALENEFFEECKKWEILNSIYERAIKENQDWLIYESKGIAAYTLMKTTSNKEFELELFNEAEKSCKKSIELGNDKERIFYLLGLLYYGGNNDLAIKNFKKAIKINSKYDMANMYLGYAYYDIKNWKDAITAFHKVNQENLRGYWEQIKRLELIGCALVEIGKTAKGMKVLENEVISEYEKGRSHYGENNTEALAHPTEMLELFEKKNMVLERERINNLINNNSTT